MPFSYDDCMQRGLLRKIPSSKDKATRSLNKAKKWLTEAQHAVTGGAFNSSVLASYMAMFHAARAVLFRDGIREKSHACVGRYLEERYAKKGMLEKEWIQLFDHHRQIRHDDQYDLSFFSTKEDAEQAAKSSRRFLKRMEALLHAETVTKPASPPCPTCGGPMVKQQGRRGEFWGCRSYPDCRGSMDA